MTYCLVDDLKPTLDQIFGFKSSNLLILRCQNLATLAIGLTVREKDGLSRWLPRSSSEDPIPIFYFATLSIPLLLLTFDLGMMIAV